MSTWSKKMGSKAMVNRKPIAGQLVCTSGHKKMPSGFSCKFNLRHTIAVDHAQDLSNKHG